MSNPQRPPNLINNAAAWVSSARGRNNNPSSVALTSQATNEPGWPSLHKNSDRQPPNSSNSKYRRKARGTAQCAGNEMAGPYAHQATDFAENSMSMLTSAPGHHMVQYQQSQQSYQHSGQHHESPILNPVPQYKVHNTNQKNIQYNQHNNIQGNDLSRQVYLPSPHTDHTENLQQQSSEGTHKTSLTHEQRFYVPPQLRQKSRDNHKDDSSTQHANNSTNEDQKETYCQHLDEQPKHNQSLEFVQHSRNARRFKNGKKPSFHKERPLSVSTKIEQKQHPESKTESKQKSQIKTERNQTTQQHTQVNGSASQETSTINKSSLECSSFVDEMKDPSSSKDLPSMIVFGHRGRNFSNKNRRFKDKKYNKYQESSQYSQVDYSQNAQSIEPSQFNENNEQLIFETPPPPPPPAEQIMVPPGFHTAGHYQTPPLTPAAQMMVPPGFHTARHYQTDTVPVLHQLRQGPPPGFGKPPFKSRSKHKAKFLPGPSSELKSKNSVPEMVNPEERNAEMKSLTQTVNTQLNINSELQGYEDKACNNTNSNHHQTSGELKKVSPEFKYVKPIPNQVSPEIKKVSSPPKKLQHAPYCGETRDLTNSGTKEKQSKSKKCEVFDYWENTVTYESEGSSSASPEKLSYQNQDEIKEPSFIEEISGDLFTSSSEVSLVHCVAEDMRMSQGIAVTFRRKFGHIAELLNQYCTTGQVAVLKDSSTDESARFIYYLVTKMHSYGKPTMETLEKSLLEMRKHCLANNVKQLAMPRIACGMDLLKWSAVLPLVEKIFKNTGIKITIYTMDKEWEDETVLYVSLQESFNKKLCDMEQNTARIFLASEGSHVDSVMTELNNKFKFLSSYEKAKRVKGDVFRHESRYPPEIVYGLVVRGAGRINRIDFMALETTLKKMNKMLKNDNYRFAAIEAFYDAEDPAAMEKVSTLFRWILGRNSKNNVQLSICWPTSVLAQCGRTVDSAQLQDE